MVATKQKIHSSCFSEFENLYFFSRSKTFFAIGPDISISSSINLADQRGYHWREHHTLAQLYKNCCVVTGTTVFVFEGNATPGHSTHYYHFLEHLLGIWSFGGEKSYNDVRLFVLAGDGEQIPSQWKGSNDLIYHLIKALFPNAEVLDWNTFVQCLSDQTVCFERVLTSDRSMQVYKKEPYYTDRMLGGYFQSLNKNSLDHLVSRVWEYSEVVEDPSDKVRVTFVQRSDYRRLYPDCEKELFEEIRKLSHVELQIVDFAVIPMSEQVNIVANTDVLIGLHSNGLTHSLLLPSEPH
jgi:hypothetical protein